MKLYRVDVPIYATAYVKAESEVEAVAKAAQHLNGCGIELGGSVEDLVSDLQFDDPDLPEVSLSPAATVGDIESDAYVEEADDPLPTEFNRKHHPDCPSADGFACHCDDLYARDAAATESATESAIDGAVNVVGDWARRLAKAMRDATQRDVPR